MANWSKLGRHLVSDWHAGTMQIIRDDKDGKKSFKYAVFEHGAIIARKRLHFRRGHWRHFEDHKTWIRWMLVGDPDLGFVEKEYRL